MMTKNPDFTSVEQDEAVESAFLQSEESQIRDYCLAHYSKEGLLDLVIDLLIKNGTQWRRFVMKTQIENENISLTRLKNEVYLALPLEAIWNWREVSEYFSDADEIFAGIWEGMEALSVNDQWVLINNIVERLNAILEQIDDSNCDRIEIEDKICSHMPIIFDKLAWSEEDKAKWLFSHLIESSFDVFPSIRDEFSEQCHTNSFFIALCQEAIDTLSDAEKRPYYLKYCAEFLIHCAKDWREIVTIEKKVARHLSDYLHICTLYLDHNEALEAEFVLTQARKKCGFAREKTQCDRMAVLIHIQLEEKKQAWQLSLRIFEENVSFDEYQALEILKRELAIDDDTFLFRAEETLKKHAGTCWIVNKPADELMAFYLSKNELEKACQWASQHEISPNLLLTLADTILDTRPNDTIVYYFRVISQAIERTNNEAYKEAISYLKKLEKILISSPLLLSEFYQKVTELEKKYKVKRNMRALLKEHYGKYL